MKRFLVLTVGLLVLAAGAASGQTPKQKEEVERLLKILKTAKDGKARAGAANELTNLGMVRSILIRDAEGALIEALKDGDGEVRLAVIQTLSVLEPYKRDRIPVLLPLLKDGENRNTKLTAVIMLGRTEGGAKEAVTPLEEIVKKEAEKADNMRDGEMIQRVNEALVGIRAHLLAGYIKALAEDKDAKARTAAAVELGKIAQLNAEQGKQAVPGLVDALKDDDADVRKAALASLTIAKPDAGSVLPGLIAIVKNGKEDKGVRLSAVSMLAALGPNARDALPFLEFMLERETKKSETDRDKPLFDKLTEAVAAIKK